MVQDGALEELTKQLDDRFRLVRKLITSEWNRDNEHGLGLTHARILTLLATEGPQKASVLADKLLITSGAVTGLADRLVELGYIARERGESDRRVVVLSIDKKGLKLLKQIDETRHALMLKLYRGMEKQEMDMMLKLFDRMIANLQKE
ncbi:MarR family winged helix-turn-helix transcriptional regulator [Paenibacillus pasadenensis]|uniref:Transcriptional regulator, MarR family n=1 Tax=Paenibacillus pasadenensis TaxID=217090 RepID=A0A2N5N908_9BACL|nr:MULTISPECIES: MarR family transcriptional regulator [Paenibacillus]PLT46837.1 Transcriptional regulator, MarR family [Paenibacillus pasadenensis]